MAVIGWLGTLSSLLKVRLVLLVTFCSSAAFIIAGGTFNSASFWLLTFSAFLTASGSCSVNNYLDRDIDAVMERTKRRPLPTRRISPSQALIVGFVLMGIGLSLALCLNPLVFVLGLAACFDYLIVYTDVVKRRNPVNVLLGSPAGGLAVLAGWAAFRGSLSVLPFLLAAVVVLWIPNHIWSLAALYVEDYRNAKVPMLPAAIDFKKALRCTASTVVLLFILTLYMYLAGFFGTVYLITTLFFGIFLLVGNLWIAIHPTRKGFYRMFKFSSPYLAVVFISMVLDLFLR